MRFKSTYFLALFFLAVATYVYLYEVKGGEERKKIEEAEKKIFIFEKDDLTWFNLKNYDNTFRFVRGPSGWEFEKPISTKSDDNQVDLVLTSLENARIERIVVDSTENLTPYGLDDPQVALQIGTEETTYDTLYLGHHNPTFSFVYAKLSGEERVVLLPASLYNNANKKFFALRDKTVLDFDRDGVQRMTLSRKDDILVFETEGDKWWIREPLVARGNSGKVVRIINTLSNLKTKEIVSEGGEDLSRFGLENPWARIDLFMGENRGTKSLVLGKARRNGDIYVRDLSREPVFLVPPSIVKLISDEADVFRDRKVIEFEREEVSEIGLIYPDRMIRCEKDSTGDWFYFTGDEPIRKRGNSSRISRLLTDLYGLRVGEFVSERGTSLEPYGLEMPPVVIEIVNKSGERLMVMAGRKGIDETDGEESEYLYIMNVLDGWIYTTSADALDKLTLDVDDLKEEEETL